MSALLGGILMAIGILIAGVSGTCLFLAASSPGFRDFWILGATLLAFSVGVALVLAGRSVMRGRRDW